MRRLLVEMRTRDLSLEEIWRRTVDVERYPGHMSYISWAKATLMGEGGHYADGTTILWFPIRIDHHITAFKPQEEVGYQVPLPMGGKMQQSVRLSRVGEEVILRAEVVFDLGSRLKNAVLGPVLERRLYRMMTSLFGDVPSFKRIR